MLPSKGGSSSGQYLDSRSVGHTGFTGTSIWFDPAKDLLIGILSNRVHLGRENKKFVTLRPQIHDKVVESLVQFGKL
jgi:CubicO group peptidase (beta-lactamase class C family)